MTTRLCSAIIVAVSAGMTVAAPAAGQLTADQADLRSIYQELVEINTTDSVGNCTTAAEAMARRLRDGGLATRDVQVIVPPDGARKGNLVARYRGSGGGKPIMLLGHLDVVEAKREEWERDPFKLVEENGFFYARGAFDDKAMVSIFVSNLIRYRKEGYEPQRDLILVATCDEEIDGSRFNGINYLLKNRRDLIDAEFALNEVGTGALDRNGKPLRLYVQVGEKIYQTYELEVRSPGGHSALPSKDNAIYRLANGLARLAAFDFPFKLTETTRAYFAAMSKVMGPRTASDMQAILHDPPDPAAIARLSAIPPLNAQFRTTCVATMLEAGHAPNALPQRARATINCRGLPGDSAEEVLKTLAGVLADDQIRITRSREPDIAPSPPLTREILEPIERVTAQMWPGIPVIPQQNVSTTDGRFTNNAGIPTYGVDGLFFDANGSGAHGLNERIRVRSLYEGHEFLYRLVKRYGGGA